MTDRCHGGDICRTAAVCIIPFLRDLDRDPTTVFPDPTFPKARQSPTEMSDSGFSVSAATSPTAGPELLGIRLGALARTLAVAFQFGLVIVVIWEFSLISRSFLDLAILAFGGFLVHALLPRAWRLPFFLALSVAGVFLVLGVTTALWVLGIGALLILIALLPLPFAARTLLLLAVGGALLYLRSPDVESAVPGAVWPILGAIFMFRLIILVYDLRHAKERPSLTWILSYFFLLPNPCFPLFPVVDFKKYQSTYYNEEEFTIYQRGAKWLFRGAYQLILYRLVYSRLTIDPLDVTSAADFLRFALTSFLLYLRVSGQFHLIIGMLLLFGFNLPETHHRYYLASSFNDFWRRINIYWKDFMMKLFYYPAFFKLRRLGNTTALVGATLFVFLSTWVLHAYQWYWLRGTLLLEWHDILFWAVLGLLVVVNSLHEQRRGRERATSWASRTPAAKAALVLRTAGTFTVICLLWSMWTADSLEQWLDLWTATGAAGWLIAGFGPLCFLAAALLKRYDRQRERPAGKARLTVSERPFWVDAALTSGAALLLVALGMPAVHSQLGRPTSEAIASLQEAQLSTRDQARLERGYYEQLMGASRHSSELWELYNRKPVDWPVIQETTVWTPTDDLLLGALQPNQAIDFKGALLTTNRWGMRDQDYTLEKPPGTFRVAVIGSSHVMGSGVTDDETFEARIERRLNADAERRPHAHYELLNFSIAARSPVQQLYLIENRVLDFEPDAVMIFAHPQDRSITVRYLSRLLRSGVDNPYPHLREVFAEAGVDFDTPDFIAQRRLKPYTGEILQWGYEQIAQRCREAGAEPLWVFLPMIYEEQAELDLEQRKQGARDAGFAVIDLSKVYDEHEQAELQVAPWDNHPNAVGHELIAESLFPQLLASPLGADLAPGSEPDAEPSAGR